MYQGYSRGVIPYEKECLTSPEILKQKAIMNEFRMSLFLAPISPVKDDETGKVVKPATLTPYKTTDLQEVYKIITTNEQLKQLTGQVRMAVESGDTQACRRLKQENLPYVTPWWKTAPSASAATAWRNTLSKTCPSSRPARRKAWWMRPLCKTP